MTPRLDDLTVAFAMRCDDRGLTYEQGVEAAEALAEEIVEAAEDRRGLAESREDRDG